MSKNPRAVNVPQRAWNLFMAMHNDPSLFKADICFDSKRHLGCYVCPLYECAEREL
jgi:hypothetical protein